MAEGKRYYWLKLHDDFFDSKRVKKLRRIAGGDTFTIIYLKLQLRSIKSNGVLKYDHLEKDFATELALDIDEDPDNVAVTLTYLLACGLAEAPDDEVFFFPFAVADTGSECSSAKRVREYRARVEALHCNGEKRREELEKEIEIEKRPEIEQEKTSKAAKTSRFTPPSVEEVAAYCESRGNGIDAEEFVAYYNSKNWYVGRNKMSDWHSAVITWEKSDRRRGNRPVKKNRVDGVDEVVF